MKLVLSTVNCNINAVLVKGKWPLTHLAAGDVKSVTENKNQEFFLLTQNTECSCFSSKL